MAGSPPRVRGKGAFWVIQSLSSRITPACAGKSSARSRAPSQPRDHPRVRGEKSRAALAAMPFLGSPPRTRGKGPGCIHDEQLVRITPAYAGKRQRSQCLTIWRKDHPRVRGEKSSLHKLTIICKGSPPRTRGKDVLHCCRVLQERITPAYAGKSAALLPSVRLGPDHPRVRGEKSVSWSARSTTPGSPPRTRGKEVGLAQVGPAQGITPAYAGKSISA